MHGNRPTRKQVHPTQPVAKPAGKTLLLNPMVSHLVAALYSFFTSYTKYEAGKMFYTVLYAILGVTVVVSVLWHFFFHNHNARLESGLRWLESGTFASYLFTTFNPDDSGMMVFVKLLVFTGAAWFYAKMAIYKNVPEVVAETNTSQRQKINRR